MITSTNYAKSSNIERSIFLVYFGLGYLVKSVNLFERKLMLLTLETYMLFKKYYIFCQIIIFMILIK